MNPSPAVNDPRRREFFLVLIFGAALLAHFTFATWNWNSAFLPGHEFRQSQTAIISYYIAEQNNFSPLYETPFLGKPWVSIPLEFPLYEWSVVLLAKATGLPHFKAARTVSLGCFYLLLPAFYLLLGELRLPPARRLLILALILCCPVYIFYSRAFLMESMVLMFSGWFLVAFARTMRERKLSWLLLAIMAGSTAGLIKSTTYLVWLLPAAVYTAWLLWHERRAGWRTLALTAGWSLGTVIVPCALVCWWVRYTDAVKAVHASAWLFTSRNLAEGNYGMLNPGARFSWETWQQLLGGWQLAIMSPWLIGGLVLAGVVFLRAQRDWVIGATALFLFGQVLFPFAYALQEYYFYTCAVFLMAAIGFVLLGALDSRLPRWSRVLIFLLPFAGLLGNYWQGYHVIQSVRSRGGSGLTEALRELTPKGSVIIVAGDDWSAVIPYNSQRKALMIRRGLEFDPVYLERAFQDLAGEDVSALVLVGDTRANTNVVRLAAKHFGLVSSPTFSHATADVYVRQFYQRNIVARLTGAHGYDQITLRAIPQTAAETSGKLQQISSDLAATAFPMIKPAPSAMKSTFGYLAYPEKGTLILNAHPDSDLWLTPPASAAQIIWEFGIFAGAYEREGKKTDGVEFIVSGEQPDGHQREIYRRLLDPASVPGDRPRQLVVIPYQPLPGETLVFSTRPNHDNNFDWAYWARIEVK